jgi:hypothetical protein
MQLELITGLLSALVVLLPGSLLAQDRPFEIGGQITFTEAGPFDEGDVGVGVRVGWRPRGLLGVEAELNVYPSDVPGEGVAVSSSRVEGLFGVTVGPQLGIVRPFARLRPGFLRYQEAPEPVACILIFPPPLSCQLAAGQTLFAFDIGGGVEVAIGRAMLFRVDIGDRMVRYPDPYETDHDVRVGVGWAVKF